MSTAVSGRWTSLLVVAAIAWTCAVVGAADAVGVSRAVQAEQRWIAAGAYVLRVEGAVREERRLPVPAAACDALAQVEGVAASFWVTRRTEPAAFAHVPGGRFSVLEVSPAVLGFLGAAVPDVPAVVVSDGLARRTGVTDGSPVQVGRSEVLQARVLPVAVLGDDLDGALLAPVAPRERADACFVRTDAAHVTGVTDLAAATLGWDDADAVVSPRLFTDEFTVDFARAHQDRTLRWAWLVAAGVLAVLWGLVQWLRRAHDAVYATFGVGAARRVVLRTSEWCVLAGVGAVWGWSTGVLGALVLGADARSALVQTTAQVVPAVLAATAVVVLVSARPAGTLLDQLKDR